jgi:3-deoxy-manno-octulosonate cytidylyltransferase (CMP-KDO synthetase)
MSHLTPLLLIPARLASTRLPRKVLADIEGKPMIVRVYERCLASQVGPVVVACDSTEVATEIEKIGGKVCLTDPDLPSGSDRVHAAMAAIDPAQEYNVIICVQGDLPTLAPELIQKALVPLQDTAVDIATLAAPIMDAEDIHNPHVVKIALAGDEDTPVRRALYFSRAPIPAGQAVKYHHIGLYAYRRAALMRYVTLGPSPLEKTERLEQLRALEAGMRIDVAVVETFPLGVDTAADLEKARLYYQHNRYYS